MPLKVVHRAQALPQGFRDDVVNIARNRQPAQHLKQIAADAANSESCLTNWLKAADVEDEDEPETTTAENGYLRKARKRIRLLEQEKDVLRRRRPTCRRRTCREIIYRSSVSSASTGSP